MKKLIIILLLSAFLVVPFSVKADELTDLMAQYQNVLIQLINVLQEQVKLLQAQIVEILATQQAQNQSLQEQSQQLGQIKQNTAPKPEPVVIVPEIKKEITIESNCGVGSKNGTDCSVYVYYWENGVKKSNDSITISSDDNGIFVGQGPAYSCSNGEAANDSGSQRKGNPLTCSTSRFLGNAPFSYRPNATGTRTLTATANGVSGTATAKGQTDKCAEKVEAIFLGQISGCNQ